jgi:hypothetical protein
VPGALTSNSMTWRGWSGVSCLPLECNKQSEKREMIYGRTQLKVTESELKPKTASKAHTVNTTQTEKGASMGF